jgi:hypothetical protein
MEISGCFMMWNFMMCSGHQIRNYRRFWCIEHVVWRCIVGLSTEVLDGVLERCPGDCCSGHGLYE